MACTNSPCILENCTEITLGPYNLGYPVLTQHFQNAKLDLSISQTNSNRQQSMDASK